PAVPSFRSWLPRFHLRRQFLQTPRHGRRVVVLFHAVASAVAQARPGVSRLFAAGVPPGQVAVEKLAGGSTPRQVAAFHGADFDFANHSRLPSLSRRCVFPGPPLLERPGARRAVCYFLSATFFARSMAAREIRSIEATAA